MTPLRRKRNARGQYETDFNAAEASSVVGNLVRQEYEAFVETLKVKLNSLSEADLADINTPDWKNNIRSVVSQYLGVGTTKVALNFIKDTTSWNRYTQENFTRKASELQDEAGEPETKPQFSQIIGALSSDYHELSSTELAKYSSLSMPSALGDAIESSLKNGRRRNRLIKVMEDACDALNGVGVVTLIFFCEKHKQETNPWPYYPDARSPDVFSVVRTFYQRCEDRGCGLNQFSLHVLADAAGLLRNLSEPPKKRINKAKRIDVLRSEFTKLVREKFVEAATPVLGPIRTSTLPDHFFTKYLPEHSFKLEGAEDITEIKLLPLQRLESLFKGLNEGQIQFKEIGIPHP